MNFEYICTAKFEVFCLTKFFKKGCALIQQISLMKNIQSKF